MQSIVTSYHGPRNTRGSRVIARANAGSVVVEWDDALSSDGNHQAAAKSLCRKMGWHGQLLQGALPGTPVKQVFVWFEVDSAMVDTEH